MAFHQFRIIHFIILAIIALTIFLYTSYYAAGPVLPQRRIHPLNNNQNRDLTNQEKQRLDQPNIKLLELHNKINDNLEVLNGEDNLNGLKKSEYLTKSEVFLDRSMYQKPDEIANKSTHERKNVAVSSSAFQLASVDYSSSLSSVIQSKKLIVAKKNNTDNIQQTLSNKGDQRRYRNMNSSSLVLTVKNVTNGISLFNSSITNASSQQASVDKGIRTSAIYEPGFIEENSNLCIDKGESLRLLILITSAPTHRDQRLAIRQTWGHYSIRRDVTIGFILGDTGNNNIEDQLQAENYMYGDIVQGHFIDSYNNLTLKTISLLEWVTEYCPNVTFVLKTDDDMFINVPKLLQFIEKHHNDKRSIFGRLAKKWKPIRNKKSKYFVSPQQYFPPIFPHFTTGPAYLMTSDIIVDLYRKALDQTYLKLEDVYTTGIVAHKLNIKRIHVNEFLNRRIPFNKCNIKNAISLHMIKSNEQFDLWKKLLDNTSICK